MHVTIFLSLQGMFLVSLPYTVAQGGYWTLIAMFVVAAICCRTGEILVDCLYDEDDTGAKIRTRSTYVDVASVAFGKYGSKLVSCAQLIELLMTCILYILLCGDLILGSFPNTPLDLSSWIMISTMFLIPCAFLQSLRSVSWLSFWCTGAHIVINAIIILYGLTKAAHWKWWEVQIRIDIWTLPISLGIIVFSYTSQIFVPTLEGNMRNRSKFSCMMYVTHIAAAIFKAVFAYIGFVTWGFETQEVITNNLPTQTLKIIINAFLFLKALFSYPLPYYAAVELLEGSFFGGNPNKNIFPSCVDNLNSLKVWALALRICLVLVTMLLAIFIPHFSILLGLFGSFTGTMLSLVWPCYFHLRIKWTTLSLTSKTFDILTMIFGFLCCFVGMYFSFSALIRAFHGLHTEPRHSRINMHSHP